MNRRTNIYDEYDMPELLSVSPAPHIRTLDTVRSMMLDVIIALLPIVIWSTVIIGFYSLLIVVLSVVSCVVSEFLYQKIMNKRVTATDLSAVVTGMILGLSMPVGVSAWVPVFGSIFAIIVVKQLFGGIGNNIVNPAVAARVFLMLCWPAQMSGFKTAELTSAATPLVSMKSGYAPTQELFSMVAGNDIGAFGEVSAIAILVGFLYLLIRKVIHWQTPVFFVAVVALLTLLFPQNINAVDSMEYHIFSGSLLFVAVFAAGDTVATPTTAIGRTVFGIGCGVITFLIRYFGSYPEGTAYAVLIMNLLVPYLENMSAPKVFGKRLSNSK